MNERPGIAEIKMGLFVLSATVILILGSLWLVGSSLFGENRVLYRLLLKNSHGAHGGDRIRLAGVNVGHVKGVELRPDEEWPVRLRVAIDRNIKIRVDATARFTSDSLLGTGFLELDPGNPGSELTPPGGDIFGTEIQDLQQAMAHLDRISEEVSTLLSQTESILGEVSHDIGPLLHQARNFLNEENAEAIGDILRMGRDTLQTTQPRIESLLDRLNSVSAQMESALKELPEITKSAASLVEEIQKALGPDGERIAAILDSLETTLTSSADLFDSIAGNDIDLGGALGDLRDTASNLKALSQILKERPFSLVRIRPEPERLPGQAP